MTSVLTWNIQCGLGCDGKHSLVRIADHIRAMSDPDIICLQEVSRFMPDLDGGSNEDQVATLANLFPGYELVFGAAINRLGASTAHRQQFGNLILSRLPVVQVFSHPLPQPYDASVKHMPRQLCEVIVNSTSGPLRVLTTHLEFHSEIQRDAQVKAIRDLHQQICNCNCWPGTNPGGGPYNLIARPDTTVICGDFNFTPDGSEYNQMLSAFDHDAPVLKDAWKIAHKNTVHDATCGIYDDTQWPEGPHARDFFFITEDLCPKIEDVIVNTTTDASDHQPLVLTLNL